MQLSQQALHLTVISFRVKQNFNSLSNRCEVFLFLFKCLEVMETVGIKQTQACEVPSFSQLLWRGGQEQYAGCMISQLFDGKILIAGFLLSPGQVMSLINNQHIPTGIQSLGMSLRIIQKQPQVTDDQLLGDKRIFTISTFFDGCTAFFIKDFKAEVKTSQ